MATIAGQQGVSRKIPKEGEGPKAESGEIRRYGAEGTAEACCLPSEGHVRCSQAGGGGRSRWPYGEV